jgi:uncharacterized membrane protein YgdD (TMEM256/DUF423 family)
MHKKYLIWGTIMAALAVALGAFAAHGLQQLTSDEKILQGFKTATQYQFYHAIGIILVGVLIDKYAGKCMQFAALSFLTGTICFSGSIYLLTYFKLQAISPGALVFITPIGGLLFIIGWLLILVRLLKK